MVFLHRKVGGLSLAFDELMLEFREAKFCGGGILGAVGDGTTAKSRVKCANPAVGGIGFGCGRCPDHPECGS